jgi:hypothetical protein
MYMYILRPNYQLFKCETRTDIISLLYISNNITATYSK